MNLREWALPAYTILTQMATGMLFLLWILRAASLKQIGEAKWDELLRRPLLVVTVTLLAGMAGAHFHLSKPAWSFMAILNLRASWLSREILFTVVMFLTCLAVAALTWFGGQSRPTLKTTLGWLAILFGFAMLFCMARIYQLPIQAPWNHWTTIPLFFGSSLVTGAVSTGAILNLDAVFESNTRSNLARDRLEFLRYALARLAGIALLALLIVSFANAVQLAVAASGDDLMQTSLALLLGLYRPLFWLRLMFVFVGVFAFCFIVIWWRRPGHTIDQLIGPLYAACLLVMVAEILGRFLFYATHVRLGF